MPTVSPPTKKRTKRSVRVLQSGLYTTYARLVMQLKSSNPSTESMWHAMMGVRARTKTITESMSINP